MTRGRAAERRASDTRERHAMSCRRRADITPSAADEATRRDALMPSDAADDAEMLTRRR